MQLGMIGIGRMGGNMVRRLMRAGHECVVYNRSQGPVDELVKDGARGSTDLAAFVSMLAAPRAIWLMVPAAVVDQVLVDLAPLLTRDDVIIDGGNSYYRDDIGRAAKLSASGLHYVDCGTSGGVWGLERGYCLMIGGEPETVKRLDPIFATLAPAAARYRAQRHARPVSGRRSAAISTAVRTAPGTSSRWCTTASSTD
jgi:6-phosphogluconate dehydrogenase